MQGFISDGVCRVAVPMFFAISGYLATNSINNNFSLDSYLKLLSKRVKSLLIPYFLVSALGIGLVVTLQLIPISKPFFNNFSIDTTTAKQWLWVWTLSPVPYQLWFIRFLMDYLLFYPVLYLFIKYARLPALASLGFLWMYSPIYSMVGISKVMFSLASLGLCILSDTHYALYMTTSKLELEGMFFFSVGIFASQFQINTSHRIPKNTLLLLIFGWLLWVGYRTYLNLLPVRGHFAIHNHQVVYTLVGFVLFWFFYDLIAEKVSKSQWIRSNASYSIGIFLFHEPALTIVKKIIIRLGGSSDFNLLLAFIIAPVAAFLFGLAFSRLLFGIAPSVYGLFTGNRKPKKLS